MWDSLFGWVSSSSLAYIYGKEESAHEEFLSVNGKMYPRRIILGDGLSSEIKETIAGCLARALPRVATYLRLPIAISELEKGLVLFQTFFSSVVCYRSTNNQIACPSANSDPSDSFLSIFVKYSKYSYYKTLVYKYGLILKI